MRSIYYKYILTVALGFTYLPFAHSFEFITHIAFCQITKIHSESKLNLNVASRVILNELSDDSLEISIGKARFTVRANDHIVSKIVDESISINISPSDGGDMLNVYLDDDGDGKIQIIDGVYGDSIRLLPIANFKCDF